MAYYEIYGTVDDVAATATAIGAPVNLDHGGRITLQIDNDDASNAFTAFKVQIKAHKDADWTDYLSSTDFNEQGVAADPRVILVSTDPTTLAAASSAVIEIDCGAAHSVQFLVTGAGGATVDATIRGKAGGV